MGLESKTSSPIQVLREKPDVATVLRISI